MTTKDGVSDPYVRFYIKDGVEIATCLASDFRAAMNERDRLRAAFDAHHPPNSQAGYTCNVCGEEHPEVVFTGGAWADLQSETEAIDGDQVL